MIPDIVLVRNDVLIIIELTCCFETNFAKPSRYKINRYKNIYKTCNNSKRTIDKIFDEVYSLGFVKKDLK